MRALDDLRVIELSETAAAAFAGRLCADAGAEVLLIEPPDGHPLRREAPFCGEESLETSAVHLHVNAGKRSIVLDLRTQADALRGLVIAADIFITDLATAELDPLGLSWTALHGDAPELVMTQVTPFGDSGPFRRYVGTNLVCLALGGQLKITGDPSREPLSNYGAQAEYQGGLSAFAGTGANLLLRDASGAGEYLDLSIQDVVATNLEHRGPALNLGLVANRAGLSVSATYGVYPCADGWVYITAFAPALWDRLKAVVELAELEEERFSTQAGRLEHNDELQAILTGWTLSKSSEELRAFAQRGEPLTVTETPERLLDSEQWRGRGVAHTIEHPAAGAIALLGPPWLDAGAPPRPAPALGEANGELLGARSEERR
ncbi:MAG: CoA transferase [Chloroflexi bacterium]|nr:CoA transferase [Chloroflexota bacterium]